MSSSKELEWSTMDANTTLVQRDGMVDDNLNTKPIQGMVLRIYHHMVVEETLRV